MASEADDMTSDTSDTYERQHASQVDKVLFDYEEEIKTRVTNANQPQRFLNGNEQKTGTYSVVPPNALLSDDATTCRDDVTRRNDGHEERQADVPCNPGKNVHTRQRDHLFKILVVGEYGVGKTSIIRRYTEGIFVPAYKVTIGVDFALKVIEWDDNTRVKLQLWDIAGHERFGNMTRVFYKYAVAAIVVYDLTRPDTLQAVIKWLQDVRSKAMISDKEPLPCVLLANKNDVEDIHIDKESLDEFCRINAMEGWFPTSAKSGQNIDDVMRFVVERVLQATEAGNVLKRSLSALTLNEDLNEEMPHISANKKCCS